MGYCIDCPDREACHQGVISCELSKKFANAAALLNQSRGTTIMTKSNETAKATPTTGAVDQVIAEAAALSENTKKVDTTVPTQKTTETDQQDSGTAVVEEKKLSIFDKAKSFVKQHPAAVGFAASIVSGLLGVAVGSKLSTKPELVEVVETIEPAVVEVEETTPEA